MTSKRSSLTHLPGPEGSDHDKCGRAGLSNSGFPMPYGWLPWAIIRTDTDGYIGLYTCDAGHAWACSWGSGTDDMTRAEARDLILSKQFAVSPTRTLPSDFWLNQHMIGEWRGHTPSYLDLEMIDWHRATGLPNPEGWRPVSGEGWK